MLYLHTIDEEKDTDVYTVLTAKERESAKQYVRFVIRGKLCRPVAVLLNKYMLRCSSDKISTGFIEYFISVNICA